MKKRWLCLLLAAVCLLSGCASILDREYGSVEPHSSKYWESETDDTLRAESYQDLVNDLLLLIGQHTEDATVRFYSEDAELSVSDTLEKAAAEVQQETPLGAYAVEYITSTNEEKRGYWEIELHLSYRRTAEDIQAIVNATSTAALPDLLSAALDAGKKTLTVRIGYWGEGEADRVTQIVDQVRSDRGLSDSAPWTVSLYPAEGDVGLIEFQLEAS